MAYKIAQKGPGSAGIYFSSEGDEDKELNGSFQKQYHGLLEPNLKFLSSFALIGSA